MNALFAENSLSQTGDEALRHYIFSEEYIRLLLLLELSSNFREEDGFLAQLSKFKLLGWYDDMREQLLDEFVWRIIALLELCLTDNDSTRRHILSIVTLFSAAHSRLLEAALMLVEKSNCSRKALKVKNQAVNHRVPDHFDHLAVRALKSWFYSNWANPFPSSDVKAQLATASGLSAGQVQAWFINWRDRNWKVVREELQQRRAEEEARLAQLRHALAQYYAAMHTYAATGLAALDTLADERAALGHALLRAGVRVPPVAEDAQGGGGDEPLGVNGAFQEVVDERGRFDDCAVLTQLIASVCAQVAEGASRMVSLPTELTLDGVLEDDDED